MEVPWSYCLEAFCIKVLGEIVSKVFLAWVPCDVEVTKGNLVGDAEKMHFHGWRSLFFNRVICNSKGGGIIAMDRGWWLFVPKFF